MLRLSTGIVSKIEHSSYQVVQVTSPLDGLAQGAVFALKETYCAAIIESGKSIAYHDVACINELSDHPVYVGAGLRAYIGAPIMVDGTTYGTLNFSDVIPRTQPFSDDEVFIVESMAALIGRFIERQDRRRQLQDTKRFFELMFRHAIVGAAVAKIDGRIIDVNDAMLRTIEYPRDEVIGRTARDFTHPDDLDLSDDLYRQLVGGEINHFYLSKRYVSKSGRVIDGEIGVTLVRNDQGEPAFLILQLIDRSNERAAFRDLTAANAHLQRLSMLDGLTGMPNRRAFDEAFEQSLKRCRNASVELSLVLFDVDHFKRINDQYGHQIGDEVLINLAALVKKSLRSLDIAARVGGEEFALILPEMPAQEVALVVERLRTRIDEAPWPVPGVTCSFGIAHLSAGVSETRTFYREADEALYNAKAAGRNRICVYQNKSPT